MNSLEKFNLTDSDFHSVDTEQCDLLIQITPTRLSFAVIDKDQNQLKALSDFPLDKKSTIQDIFIHEQLLNQPYHRVKIAIQTYKFIFIPTEAYSESSLSDYNNYIQANPATLTSSTIATQQIKNIAAFDDKLTQFLNEKLQPYQLVSTANPLIDAATKIYPDNNTQLILNFHADNFEAVVLKDSRLSFYNIFSIATADDFNYFLLLLLKELNLNPGEITPIVCGQLETSSEIYNRIQKYFTQIKFANSSSLINLPAALRLAPVHRYFSLFGLNLCE